MQVTNKHQHLQVPQPIDQTIPSQGPSQGLHKPITTPVKVNNLKKLLLGYPKRDYLITGFQKGFSLGYMGPRKASSSGNLKSCRDHPDVVMQKIATEVKAHRVKGPFPRAPFSDMKISPIGIVPKKVAGQFRLIHHLSFPHGESVNDFIYPSFSSVQYASFDDAVDCLIKLGRHTQMAKTDIDSAFRLIPIIKTDHPLLGFKFGGNFHSVGPEVYGICACTFF